MSSTERKSDKSRVIIYCVESTFAIFGIIFLILALCNVGFENLPKGSRISSAFVAMLFGFLPLIVEKIFRYHFPMMLHIIYYFYVLASVIVGSCLGVFRIDVPIMGEMIGWYDKVTHAVLGYVLCIVAIYLSQRAKLWGKSKFGDILLVVAISMAYASLWEIFEFTVDHTIPGQSMQRNSLIDTMLDMTVHFALTIVFVIQYLIEKCAKVNLGIAFMEKNLETGGKLPKKVKKTDASLQEQTETKTEEQDSEQN